LISLARSAKMQSVSRFRGAEGNRISFRISILASGSTGNSTLLETSSTTLLIDAGLGKKEMLRRFEALGRARPERVDAILVTHEHSDHSTGLAQMAREWNCPAYLTEPTHREIVKMFAAEDPEKPAYRRGSSDGNPSRKPSRKAHIDRVEYIRAGERFEIGDIEINPFAIPHDAADPVGYAFRTNGTKVALVTDLGYMPELVKHHLREADFLILESNHDLDMLKVGPYPWYIKQRVMSRTGHLSNSVVSDFLSDSEVFDGRARYLVLAHLSEQNNTPDIAQICAEQALASRPADFAFRGSLHIASQRVPLGPFEL
jgi:phosphoribosyl 1,2-cyclic phosphodiesterase